MGMNYKKVSITVAETLLSTLICAIGVALFVESGLGSDTIDVLIDGLHRTLGITLGRADQIFAFTFLLLAILCNRKYIGWPSLLYTCSVGFAIDAVNLILIPLHISTQPFIFRLVLILFAQLCFGLSYAIFQTIEKGMNTVDAVLYFFTEHFKIPYVIMRTSLDIIFFLLGFYLGGVIGIGTIISTCLTGITTNVLYQKIKTIKAHSKHYRSIFFHEVSS